VSERTGRPVAVGVLAVLAVVACRGGQAKIGDAVRFDDSTWVVMEVRELGATLAPNDAGTGAPVRTAAAGRFVAVRYEVESRLSDEAPLRDKPRLADAAGKETAPLDVEALYVPEQGSAMGVESLPAHGKKRFWTVFDADRGAGHALVLHGLALFGPKKLVTLGF